MSDSELLVKVYERVGELHAKLDSYVAEHSDLKGRVARLETNWSKLVWAASIIALPFTALLKHFKSKSA